MLKKIPNPYSNWARRVVNHSLRKALEDKKFFPRECHLTLNKNYFVIQNVANYFPPKLAIPAYLSFFHRRHQICIWFLQRKSISWIFHLLLRSIELAPRTESEDTLLRYFEVSPQQKKISIGKLFPLSRFAFRTLHIRLTQALPNLRRARAAGEKNIQMKHINFGDFSSCSFFLRRRVEWAMLSVSRKWCAADFTVLMSTIAPSSDGSDERMSWRGWKFIFARKFIRLCVDLLATSSRMRKSIKE